MVKSSNITSEVVGEKNQDVFIKFLKQERDASRQRDRNADWFDYLLDKDFWEIYPMWTMSRIEDDVLLCEMRKQLVNDERPTICDRCFPVEDQGGHSFRMNYNIDHKEVSDQNAVDENGGI